MFLNRLKRCKLIVPRKSEDEWMCMFQEAVVRTPRKGLEKESPYPQCSLDQFIESLYGSGVITRFNWSKEVIVNEMFRRGFVNSPPFFIRQSFQAPIRYLKLEEFIKWGQILETFEITKHGADEEVFMREMTTETTQEDKKQKKPQKKINQ